ncbi:hypothetical protein L202_07532 [Cryptococcus amylolentus CBS 6039]|uniref:Scavenger mRNA-decapping enzyme DcpS n=2 Tax=Cryptococcus amylolentus TaxID=104669 RepID=A0A1E3HCK6_9TREE|nr:hypothetical protein L202_07532 [Cryptococcus amylolentus CBS 6039]ODN74063.1 hypothetical protein L202_07532 [Cryptococcus amylolentus CBS 6039]ODO00143.1 hypothetical protein I350_06768 [Cryptococcus amylolentus CBS 6273]
MSVDAQATPLQLTPALLGGFQPERILSESTFTGSTFILGRLEGEDAIVHLQKSLVAGKDAEEVVKRLEDVKLLLENTPYYSAHAWVKPDITHPDYNLKLICPATADHIKKYSIQERYVVRETAEVYETVVKPFIDAMPVSKIQWVYEILEGRKEVDRVLVNKSGPDGFVVLPDLKWDETTQNALYLVVITQDRAIKSLRDLRPSHLPLLQDIQKEAWRVAEEKHGVDKGKLRLFVHYHPTYYHFHVHVVHISHDNLGSQVAGQAHLLEDLISLLELSPADGPSLLAQKSFTYTLGAEHKLFPVVHAAGAVLGNPELPTVTKPEPNAAVVAPINPSLPTPSAETVPEAVLADETATREVKRQRTE